MIRKPMRCPECDGLVRNTYGAMLYLPANETSTRLCAPCAESADAMNALRRWHRGEDDDA